MERPLVVVLGGAPGAGKSTIATRLAPRLGVTRVIATDVIRQVLRAFFGQEAMPSVHRSAFEVDLAGFADQARQVARGVGAIVDRAAAERTPLIVEGVHAVPGLLEPSLRERCVMVEALLVVRDEALHRSHFTLRGAHRPADRYLARFEAIRALQDELCARARAAGVPIIDNEGVDAALERLTGLVTDGVAQTG